MVGATDIYIFTGIMDAKFYTGILEDHLLPFIHEKFPNCELRFMQDNDPKHCSRHAQQYFQENNVNWWRTPLESPDLENMMHELKEYLRAQVKPKHLIEGIKAFWATVDQAKCRKYIGHLRKVIPRVIELRGDATGY